MYTKNILIEFKKTNHTNIDNKEGELPPLQKAHLLFSRLARWFGIRTESDSTSTTLFLDQVLHMFIDNGSWWDLTEEDLLSDDFLY